MEFITVEQFKEQPKEVQEVFLDWWKPEIGDLATGRYANIVAISSQRDIDAVKIYKGEPYAIPLFTEGQLRKFIEDKINIKVQFNIHFLTLDYVMITGDSNRSWIHTGTNNLLKAYWKVACMVAKEGLNEI